MTPNEITTLIAMGLDREMDMPFRFQLWERVKYWRSRLIDNMVTKNRLQREQFRQPLYLKMEWRFVQECLEGVTLKQAVTIEDVPLMVYGGNILFDYVGGVDGKSPFRKTVAGMGNYLNMGKFSARFPAYEYIGRKFIVDKNIAIIRVDGIADDPMLVASCNCACGMGSCDTWDTEFPCPGDVVQLIVQSILQIDYNRKDAQPTVQIPVADEAHP